jgi:GAF domain-containing protein
MESNPSENAVFDPKEATRLLYKHWRDKFVMPLLIGSLVLGALALIPAVSSAGNTIIKALFITTYLMTGIVTVVRFSYPVRMSVFLFSIYALGLGELFTHGILGDSLFFFLGLIIFTTILLSPQAGILTIILDVLTFILIGWFMLSGQIIPLNPYASPAQIEDWISASAVMIMFGAVIILGFQRLEAAFLEAQIQIDTTLTTLKDERNNLENKVVERTQQLRRVNNIGRAVTAILDPDELLARAVYLIGDEFECYYTAIFLTDITGQWAELKVATGDAGKVLRENKHHLDINGKSAVGTAIRTKQARIALDSGTDPVRFDNPLLPYTRSQIALPLAIGDRIIGALEMHSTKEKAFSQQEVDTYQNMANQISIALENSRLFTEAQQSLSEMSATQQQYLQGAWLSLASEQKLEYTLGNNALAGKQEIEIPLTLRDQIIGQINMSNTDEWTPEQKNLIESIAAQAALALENARLVEESQSIAARERLVNEITSKVWASTTMDGILQTTVRELGRALEAAEVDIEISMGDNNE